MLASCCDAPSGSPWLPLQMEIRLTPSARRSANKDKEPHGRLRHPWADRSSNRGADRPGKAIVQHRSPRTAAANGCPPQTGSGAPDQLLVDELIGAVAAELAPETGALEAPERQLGAVCS